jgi:hypothetical protein
MSSLLFNDLPDLVHSQITKYNKLKCLKELEKDKFEIPFGDFGCLARQIRSSIKYDEDGNEVIPFSGYIVNIYECVENYINHFNSCNDIEKRHILEGLKAYESNLNGPLYQSFPFQEWLYHPINGNIHSGASYSWTNANIREYLLRPEEYKLQWRDSIKKYLD